MQQFKTEFMPGINLFSKNRFKPSSEYNSNNLEQHTLFNNPDFELSIQVHDNYPYTSFSIGDQYDITIEGLVYNFDQDTYIKKVISLLRSHTELADYIKILDGDFIIVVHDKKINQITTINDSFSRLPMYLWSDENDFILTRNISFITQQIELKYSQIALAENLLFGFNFGNTTIWEDIERIPPNGIITIDIQKLKIEVKSYFDIGPIDGGGSIEDVIEEFVEVYDKSLETRLKKLKSPTISMSGGLDSRFVAAGISKSNTKVNSITFGRNDNSYNADLKYSQEIMKRLKMDKGHRSYKLPTETKNDLEELNDLKQSLNALSMSFMMPYLRERRQLKEDVITGFGGDTYLVGMHPLRNMFTTEQLCNYIIKSWALCSVKTAATIANITEKELKERILNHVKAFPYTSMNDNYTYYMIRHHAPNYAYEGEDRIRHFAWSTAPIYNPKLLRLGLSISQKKKKYGRFYKRLFDLYPGNLNDIVNPNWLVNLNNLSAIKKIHIKQTLKTRLPHSVLLKHHSEDLSSFQCYDDLIDIKSRFDRQTLNVDKLPEQMKIKFYWQIYSIMVMIDKNKAIH